MSDMNTERSDALVERFRQRPFRSRRKSIETRDVFPARADEVFALLCPSREADWIPGWDCELIFTESGYAEEHCVFRTEESTAFGPGLWVFSRYEPPHLLEIVRFMPDMVVNLTISLSESPDGTTEGVWKVLFTGLNEEGNRAIERIPEDAYDGAPRTLTHYLETGKMMEATTYSAHHAHGFARSHQGPADRVRSHFGK